MEPEVHLTDKYFQEVLHCFTITDIKCKRNKEIDILVINPKTLEKYHVEVRVSMSFKIKLKASYSKKRISRRDGIDYFANEKFNHKAVLDKVKEFFGSEKYNKILVIWGGRWSPYFVHIREQAKELYGIEVWSVIDIIDQMVCRRVHGSRDSVVRMAELMGYYQRWSRDTALGLTAKRNLRAFVKRRIKEMKEKGIDEKEIEKEKQSLKRFSRCLK